MPLGLGSSAPQSPAHGSSKCRVAICDDVATFRQLLTTIFKWEPGFEVVGEAANGREAIELAVRTQPDVMILDIAMPIMDGIEALPEILKAAPGTRVLILTAFGSERIRAQALRAGASGYLEKGATPTALVAAVRAAAEGAREPA